MGSSSSSHSGTAVVLSYYGRKLNPTSFCLSPRTAKVMSRVFGLCPNVSVHEVRKSKRARCDENIYCCRVAMMSRSIKICLLFEPVVPTVLKAHRLAEKNAAKLLPHLGRHCQKFSLLTEPAGYFCCGKREVLNLTDHRSVSFRVRRH